MAKLTKAQKKNLLKSIRDKAFKLFHYDCITLADYDKIARVCIRGINKLE